MLDYPLFIIIKMNILKDAHTAILSGQTGCGKTHFHPKSTRIRV